MNRDVIARRLQESTVGRWASGMSREERMERGDHDLNPGMAKPTELVQAAVLVPIVERREGFTVLLTQRTDHLSAHAGQISFPGGRLEATDAGLEAAALRETEEEVGLMRDRIEVVGQLDLYVTRTGFEVTPVVGIVTPPFSLTPDPFEVADVFEVPLSFIIDPANHLKQSRLHNGIQRQFYVLPYDNRYIWGATAGMLVNLSEVLRKAR
ncbi:MAG: CoA pyrophosphatase [Alphaproteobacteria bacterium]|nr:CoA pyrophosphatase [Alphaproteobacteria bacterium]